MIGQSIQCDNCGETVSTFDEQNVTKFRVDLTANKGWYFLKIDRQLMDFCSDDCCQKWLFNHKRAVHAAV